MKLNKTFLTLGLAAALLQMSASSFAQTAGGNRQNPLLTKSSLPFGAPDFSKIQESDYLPAIEAAIREQRANIQKIVNNKKKPNFQNTILAYEERFPAGYDKSKADIRTNDKEWMGLYISKVGVKFPKAMEVGKEDGMGKS